jgi:hypothetical protein
MLKWVITTISKVHQLFDSRIGAEIGGIKEKKIQSMNANETEFEMAMDAWREIKGKTRQTTFQHCFRSEENEQKSNLSLRTRFVEE